MQAKEITIRKAKMNDLPTLFIISSTVHAKNYTELIPDEYKKEFFDHYELTAINRDRFINATKEKMQSSGYGLHVATLSDGTILGYISYEVLEGDMAKIRSLFIDPIYQGQGVGSLLMNQVIEKYSNRFMYLFVIEGNTGASSLYKKYGFEFAHYEDKKTFFGANLLYMFRESKV